MLPPKYININLKSEDDWESTTTTAGLYVYEIDTFLHTVVPFNPFNELVSINIVQSFTVAFCDSMQ